MTTAAAKHRKALKDLRDEVRNVNDIADYYRREAESERQRASRDRASEQGFREGVEFAIRALVKEINTWRGGGS